jgi:hypothetical protein
MILASKLYPSSFLLWPHTLDERLREFVQEKAITIPNFLFTLENELGKKFGRIVVTDTRKYSRLKHIESILDNNRNDSK